MQSCFRARYIEDLEPTEPDVFIDAVVRGAFLWQWGEHDGYESDPALKRFVEDRYESVATVLAPRSSPAGIFVRRSAKPGPGNRSS